MNAQAKDLQVEIMDENGNVITGFSREDCKEMNDLNSTKQLVTWKSGKKLAALSGKIVKVKFLCYLWRFICFLDFSMGHRRK